MCSLGDQGKQYFTLRALDSQDIPWGAADRSSRRHLLAQPALPRGDGMDTLALSALSGLFLFLNYNIMTVFLPSLSAF